jgi:predicted DsbA family dithiol-disulfide isomerase
VREELGASLRVEVKSFILIPEEQPGRTFRDYHRMHRRAAGEQDTDAPRFEVPPVGHPYPRWSLPALEAAAWVRAIHPGRFDAFDLGVFEAFFGQLRDISDPGVLAELATQAGMDGGPLVEALRTARYRPIVLQEHREAVERGIQAIPAVLLPGRAPILGAVSYADLHQAVAGCLAGRVGPDRVEGVAGG